MNTKYFINLILVLLFFGTLDSVGNCKNKWPYKKYSYAKIYLYNLKNNFRNNCIINNSKINKHVVGNGILLTKKQSKEFIELSNKQIGGLIAGLSKTFLPHHAIVYFDSQNNAIASIRISFDGEIVKLKPKSKHVLPDKTLSDKEIKNLECILEEYRKIVEQTKLPIFNNPFLYEKYFKKIEKRINPIKINLIQNNPIKQLESKSYQKFDLSGIVKYKNNIYVVADKKWNNFIYQIDTIANKWYIKNKIKICLNKKKNDYESIDINSDGIFYITDEYSNELYYKKKNKCTLSKINLDWTPYKKNKTEWFNKGFEGMAVDSINNIVYMAKERSPGNIYRVDLNTSKITEPFSNIFIKDNEHYDFSDLKYQNGFLYVLERKKGLITRINIKTKELYSVTFQRIVLNNNMRIYNTKYPEYGMSEALLLTKKHIFIGIDNNGETISSYGQTFGLQKNNKPIILIFERPENF